VAVGKRDKLSVFGDDYDTPDGTCERDYIHVMDVASGHVAALEHMQPGFDAINLGAGSGESVMEVITAFEKSSNTSIPYVVAPRRAGDLPVYYADVSKAAARLGWRTSRTLQDACDDTWRWQTQNPNGYN
jgi:UDP-glucose 4-epimerase